MDILQGTEFKAQFRMSNEYLDLYGRMYEMSRKAVSFEEYCREQIQKHLKSVDRDETYHIRFYGGNEWWES